MLFYVRQAMKPLAQLPSPTEVPQGAPSAQPLPAAAGTKRAPIGPQLPEALKRRRLEGEEGGGGHDEQQQIGPALPPVGWQGGAVAPPAAVTSPNPFARSAAGAAPRAAANSSSKPRPPAAGGVTRIGPPLRHVAITLRPKSAAAPPPAPAAPAPAALAPAAAAASPRSSPLAPLSTRTRQQSSPAAAAASPPPTQHTQRAQQHPEVAAAGETTKAALLARLRTDATIRQSMVEAAHRQFESGLPAPVPPSQLPPEERRLLHAVVGRQAARLALQLLQPLMHGGAACAEWRAGVVESEALAIAAE